LIRPDLSDHIAARTPGGDSMEDMARFIFSPMIAAIDGIA
jgi:hypothetical protein